MSVVLGIDVGGSTTKIVGFRSAGRANRDNGDPREQIGMLQVRAADQITSLYGAIGNFLHKYDTGLDDVELINLTGVGASFIDDPIYGINTCKVDEFQAIGRGALHLSGLGEALVVSLGTGTAFVRAGAEGMTHIGGSGVGGGTIIGLATRMLGKSDFDAILSLAADGNLENVDLTVSDILGREIPTLPAHLTAANFGKIKSTASEADIALGIINMVLQAAGMLAVFAARGDSVRDVVLTGSLTAIPQAESIFARFKATTTLAFSIPPDAVYATAIGAALQGGEAN